MGLRGWTKPFGGTLGGVATGDDTLVRILFQEVVVDITGVKRND